MARVGASQPRRVPTGPGRRALASATGWLTAAVSPVSFLAVGAGVPWRGLLLAYGAGQLAAILPITPGGLGVVEGSLTVALVTFGGAQDSTVAAVLLYRLISFWLVLPVGWGAWAAHGAGGPQPPARAGGEHRHETGLRLMRRKLACSPCWWASCGTTRPGISNGSVSACYRAIPTARAALRRHARQPHRGAPGAGRLWCGADLPPAAQAVLAGDNDTTVCAVAFKGTFMAGQVNLAPPDEAGPYAVVLVTSRHLHLLASVVLDQLPRSLGKRTL